MWRGHRPGRAGRGRRDGGPGSPGVQPPRGKAVCSTCFHRRRDLRYWPSRRRPPVGAGRRLGAGAVRRIPASRPQLPPVRARPGGSVYASSVVAFRVLAGPAVRPSGRSRSSGERPRHAAQRPSAPGTGDAPWSRTAGSTRRAAGRNGPTPPRASAAAPRGPLDGRGRARPGDRLRRCRSLEQHQPTELDTQHGTQAADVAVLTRGRTDLLSSPAPGHGTGPDPSSGTPCASGARSRILCRPPVAPPPVVRCPCSSTATAPPEVPCPRQRPVLRSVLQPAASCTRPAARPARSAPRTGRCRRPVRSSPATSTVAAPDSRKFSS